MEYTIIDARTQLIKRMQSLLGARECTEFADLSQHAVYVSHQIYQFKGADFGSNQYANLSEERQCNLYYCIGMFACTSAKTLEAFPSRQDQNVQQMRCPYCDSDSNNVLITASRGNPKAEEALSTVASLIKISKSQKYRRPRVAAMLALKRLLSHTANADHLNLSTSSVGQWCLQALHSSIRELRIAAG